MLSTALNRLYYAIFYAVAALAQKFNFITSKHSQLLGWFNREFIKTGKLILCMGNYIENFMITEWIAIILLHSSLLNKISLKILKKLESLLV